MYLSQEISQAYVGFRGHKRAEYYMQIYQINCAEKFKMLKELFNCIYNIFSDKIYCSRVSWIALG